MTMHIVEPKAFADKAVPEERSLTDDEISEMLRDIFAHIERSKKTPHGEPTFEMLICGTKPLPPVCQEVGRHRHVRISVRAV